LKHLYLLRHAKSSWDDPNLPDHDRPLSPRGTRAGTAMATAVAALSPRPGLVVCSSAARAMGTLALVRPALDPCPVTIEPLVYAFEAAPLRRHLAGLDDALDAVLVVGHNPALELLARELATADTGPAMTRLRHKFPTAALAELDLSITTWATLSDAPPGVDARLRRFTRPADLPAA